MLFNLTFKSAKETFNRPRKKKCCSNERPKDLKLSKYAPQAVPLYQNASSKPSSCGYEEESVFHILLECSRSRCIWRFSMLGFDFSTGPHTPFNVWFVEWFQSAPDDSLRGLSLYILWAIWKDRNKILWSSETPVDPGVVVRQATMEWASYKADVSPPLSSVSDHVRAVAPSPGRRRLVVDGAFHANTNNAAAGWVLYNSIGGTIDFGSTRFQATSSLQAEARACLVALVALAFGDWRSF
ncbi:OLC1v1027663C1 [Oldenlandia corymbosa var. corymbosa]|uniref:OLC1v1027663C1 n=1 Tax=Oldenlandia corymbosa var. corymbosa TaxID=529605 RepID=A0AAV1CA03_OLDCO|nr:OLC1v1027663C1 [Oldenlandia corymbosa var. corymbosa]